MSGNAEDNFQALDFIIFFGIIAISLAIGSFFAFRDRKKKSTDNYYFGERQISTIAVAISISVSYKSAVSVLGIPADVYLHGNAIALVPVTFLLADIMAIAYHIPLFHRLKMLSVFEYLELRFHRSVRMLVSGLRLMSYTLYMAVCTYLPALALHTVTPLDLRWTIALTSIICTIYTSLGGVKAVIWADVMQAGVMVAGMLATYFVTLQSLGGFDAVMESAARGGRLTMFKFDPDPRVKYTVWSIVFGMAINSYYGLICNQVYVQRWLSCKTIRQARIAVAMSFVPLALMDILTVLTGLGVYAFYEGCDPLLSKRVNKPDQIVPFMMVDLFRDLPGMAGLMVSTAFSGTLSTVSSGINALSAMTLSDFVGVWFPKMKQTTRVRLSKILSFAFGTIVMISAYAVTLSSTNILSVVVSITGLFAGPVVAVFMMAVFMPWINYKSVLIGCTAGFLFLCWIQISVLVMPVDETGWKSLHLSTGNCTFTGEGNSTIITNSMVVSKPSNENREIGTLGATLFAISPYLYGLVGTAVCIIATHVASLLTGFEQPSQRIKRLTTPFLIWPQLYPTRMRQYFDFDQNTEEKRHDCEESDIRLTHVPKCS